MADSDKLYAGFLGTWILIPESCDYQQGAPPRQGRYEISEVDGRLSFFIAWTDSEGAQHQVTFSGIPNGERVPFSGGVLADALSICAPTRRRLDSSAYKDGEELMVAERHLDDTGNAMRVIQQVRLRDGTRPTNISVYQRLVAN